MILLECETQSTTATRTNEANDERTKLELWGSFFISGGKMKPHSCDYITNILNMRVNVNFFEKKAHPISNHGVLQVSGWREARPNTNCPYLLDSLYKISRAVASVYERRNCLPPAVIDRRDKVQKQPTVGRATASLRPPKKGIRLATWLVERASLRGNSSPSPVRGDRTP